MAVLKMWGNSPALRFSSSLLKGTKFAVDDNVKIKYEVGRIIIESEKPTYDIEKLIAAISPQNLHGPDMLLNDSLGAEVVEW
jgi:antitoxin MazE